MASLDKRILILLLLAGIGINYRLANANSRDAYLIVGLPLQCKDESAAVIWERGEEISAGAQIAMEDINSRPDILPEHTLRIVEIDIGECGQQNNYNLLLEFVNTTFHQHLNVIGAVGIFCPTEVQISIPLLGTPDSWIILRSAVKAASTTNLGKPNQRIIQALFDFLEALEWSNIAAITANGDNYFFSLIEQLDTQTSASAVHNGSKVNMIVYDYDQSISQCDLPRIILVSIRSPLAIMELLCNAYREDLMWPKHV